MGKIKRGGYFFVTWKGDHSPYHVHVYDSKGLVVKWDLENDMAMEGSATKKIRKLIAALQEEGEL